MNDPRKDFWLGALTLWQREMVRFFRQRSRVIGAVVPPVLFWFLIGSGLGTSFQLPAFASMPSSQGVTYLQYFFPGTIVLIVLFTAIFSTISVIEDRHEGFLQSVMVAPLARESLVWGKILGGATLAFVQALAFLIFAPVVGFHISVVGWIGVLAMLAVLSVGLTGLGFALAWKLDSTQGFHAVMNLFLIPMWLLSGALFPASGAPGWLKAIMAVNPVTYGLAFLQQHLTLHGQPLLAGGPSALVSWIAILLFAAATFFISITLVQKD